MPLLPLNKHWDIQTGSYIVGNPLLSFVSGGFIFHTVSALCPATDALGRWQFLAMMTSSNGNIFRIIGHLCGEFTSDESQKHKSQLRGALMFFDLRLNKRLGKQSWGWWFETPSRPLWRHCNVLLLSMAFTFHTNCLWMIKAVSCLCNEIFQATIQCPYTI